MNQRQQHYRNNLKTKANIPKQQQHLASPQPTPIIPDFAGKVSNDIPSQQLGNASLSTLPCGLIHR